jgi:hypothetical protein
VTAGEYILRRSAVSEKEALRVTIWNDPTDETNLLNRPARTENWFLSDEARLRRVAVVVVGLVADVVGGYSEGELSRSIEDVFD